MTTIRTQFKKWPVISGLSMFFLTGTFAGAQSSPGSTPQDNNRFAQDRDITRRELANFDEFLDSHREIAEQVRKDPSLLDNQQYLKDHPDLQRYLWNHPGVREEVKENPTAFMHQENRYDRQEDAAAREATREKLASFDQFLDKHREIAEQVRRNPSLLDNQQFLKDHPELQAYLQDHTGVRNALRENPDAFMLQENRYDRREDSRDLDTTRGQLASFDQFLDKHREVAEQVRKNPSLLDNQQFLKDHPALHAYLQDHKGVREEVQENPNAFMRQENRYDRREDSRDMDTTRGQLASFDQFLDKHREVAQQVRKDPSLLDNQQFLKDHPALQAYLQDHKGVREEVQENPNAFMRQENRFDRTEAQRGDPDAAHRQFGEFLGHHTDISRDLGKDPSVVKKDEYVHKHPELQAYLNAHPEVRQGLMADPQGFVKSTQQLNTQASPAKTTPAPTTAQPKP
jgi:phage-related protein